MPTNVHSTYFATRLAGGGVFESKGGRAEFLKRAGPSKGSPVGNTKNFTTREEATAYSQSERVVMWPRGEEERRCKVLQERVDLLEEGIQSLRLEADESQASYEAAKAVIREHARTEASQGEEIARLYESLCLQQAKTSAAEGLCRAVRAQEEASQERTQTLEAWLRASLDVLYAHTDEAPELLTAAHLTSQGKADLAASDIVSELGDPVPLSQDSQGRHLRLRVGNPDPHRAVLCGIRCTCRREDDASSTGEPADGSLPGGRVPPEHDKSVHGLLAQTAFMTGHRLLSLLAQSQCKNMISK